MVQCYIQFIIPIITLTSGVVKVFLSDKNYLVLGSNLRFTSVMVPGLCTSVTRTRLLVGSGSRRYCWKDVKGGVETLSLTRPADHCMYYMTCLSCISFPSFKPIACIVSPGMYVFYDSIDQDVVTTW